jgi:hypothetical protein
MRTRPPVVLAHGNGLDEIAFVAVPVLLFVAFVLFERRHNERRRREEDAEG